MEQRRLGDVEVGAVALGAANWSLLDVDPSQIEATFDGHYRSGDDFPVDGRPETIVRHCEASLQAPGLDCIGLYQLHVPDPQVPFAETIGAFAELKTAGKIRRVGLSNVTLQQFDEARRTRADPNRRITNPRSGQVTH